MKNLKYLALGVLFGIILTKSEVISWFRIQEMFRFQSFHMYGIIGSAIVVGLVSVQLIKRNQLTTINGEPIVIPDKKFNHGVWLGGLIFGFGWAITGACPGPMFAQLGSGSGAAAVLIVAALAGTWTYSALREKLPH
ncbi:YeeE/YedE thiosulfate transporter family protein [Hymenobacter glaciei]|uniref:YeeE/YedE thiosulfate transporter family protein n=1 Tax=Hymenobacter glaciei TaxID=877209 RepID=A0ABP7TLU5_9BACT